MGAICAAVALAVYLALRLAPLPAGVDKEHSQVVTFEDGTPMRIFLTRDEKFRVRTELDGIDPLLVKATVCYEDRFFEAHPGVNPASIARAFVQDVKARRVVSGGSTISMQLARIAEPLPRTVTAKVWQVLRAFQLEARLGKSGILERYLNLAPYGRNNEGVAAASWAYFGKTPRHLTPAEVAYLVSLPQSPSRRAPGRTNGVATRAARDRVLDRMARCGIIGTATLSSAKADPVPATVNLPPFRAPHAAAYLAAGSPGRSEIRTTLDPRVQDRAERIAVSYRAQLARLGAKNASVVVIENATRKVRALVGNTDFFDAPADGQVAGFAASRSPGSALKPFLYAYALERGVITTESLLEDAPVQIGSFRPQNFGETYEGLVRAEKALSHSLNVPFVHLLQRAGMPGFLRLLRDGGLRYRDDLTYGLSVVTGALEVNLLDLTNLYVTLARGGMHGEYQLAAISDQRSASAGSRLPAARHPPTNEFRLLKESAVHLTRQALAIRSRPDAPLLDDVGDHKGRVSWKTGTSWGFRDAWAIGFNGQYTVGVWAGNFSGRPAKGIVGSQAAAPMMFDVLRAVTTDDPGIAPPPSTDFSTVRVCAHSGYRPGPACPETKAVVTVKDAAPARECPFHRQYLIEADSGLRACLWKLYGAGDVETRRYTVYPPSVASVFGGAGRPPALNPSCAVQAGGDTLRIVSPASGASYILTEGVRNTGKVPLQGYTSVRDGQISWFVNDRYIGDTRSGEARLVSLAPGHTRIVAVNSAGHKDRAEISVSSP